MIKQVIATAMAAAAIFMGSVAMAGDKTPDAKDFYKGADKDAEWFNATETVNQLKHEIQQRAYRIIGITVQLKQGKGFKRKQQLQLEVKKVQLLFEELMYVPQQFKEYSDIEYGATATGGDVWYVAGTSFQPQDLEALIQDASDAVDSVYQW